MHKHKMLAVMIIPLLGLLAAGAWGCSPSGAALPEAAVEEPPAVEVVVPPPSSPLPAWRSIDRQALVASLGWWEVARGSNGAPPRVALTFDAGSDAGATPAILDILISAGLHCTFFLTGQFVETNPELVTRMVDEGHELANHSNSHPDFTTISAAEVDAQLARTETLMAGLTGMSSKPYFRFPYGRKSNALIEQVNANGYLSVSWTVDAYDWEPSRTPQAIYSRVMSGIGPGAIVLMHCASPQEVQILPAIIGDLRTAGYQLVTVSEVLSP